MKKVVYNIILLLTFLGFFTSCKKENKVTQSTGVNSNYYSEVENVGEEEFEEFVFYDPEDVEEVVDLLVAFKQGIDEDSIGNMDIRIAIWSVFAYANSDNIEFTEYGFDSIIEDSIFISFDSIGVTEMGNWLVDGMEVLENYDILNNAILAATSDNHFLLASFELEDIEMVAGAMTFKIQIESGRIDSEMPVSSGHFWTDGYYDLNVAKNVSCNWGPYCMPYVCRNILRNRLYLGTRNPVYECNACFVWDPSSYNILRLSPEYSAHLRDDLYCELNSPCLNKGNYTDGYDDNTINGYLNAATDIAKIAENSLRSNTGEPWVITYSEWGCFQNAGQQYQYNCAYFHTLWLRAHKIYCIPCNDIFD